VRIRLIQVTTRRSGEKARREEVREDDVLGIGRGTDNDLSLPGLSVALHHATLRVDDGIRVEGVGGAMVRVNGRPAHSRRLAPGDVVGIGSFELRLLEPAAGEDLCLEVEEVAHAGDPRSELERRVRVGIRRGPLGLRALTMYAVLAMVGLAVALPWQAALWSEEPPEARPEGPLAEASIQAVQGWSVGPIARAHAQFSTECGRCHSAAFAPVGDDSCLVCHGRIEAHATAADSPPALRDMACVSCHTDHEGPHGPSERQSLGCAPCHGTLASTVPAAPEAVATDFASDHPEFRLTLATDPPSRARERVTWRPDLEEATGLLFSHVRHVGQAVENRETGETGYLRCDACHVEDRQGRSYEPVSFAKHCQDCHALGFDDDFPERQAFHGDPARMRAELLEFYSAVALGGIVPPGRGPAVLRAAPGGRLSDSQRRAALAWAENEAHEADTLLMAGDERCGMCHPIQAGTARDGGAGVAPVDVPHAWLPHARFSHRSHQPSACHDCHPTVSAFDPEASPEVPRPAWAAPDSHPYGLLPVAALAAEGLAPSDSASDVSIPGIEGCRDCHGGAEAPTGRVASACDLCHGFHRAAIGPMVPPPPERTAERTGAGR